MYQNPWQVERMAQYEQDRIQKDMKQIRLEEQALKANRAQERPTRARAHRPSLALRIALAIVRLMVSVGS